ncbi:hypothetical protein NDU88_003736 [Pleurodeles waltl]|uniref:Uncharacterized protein n=1 Tax=Pleurodeles waltl TaxID=8319 RepID=A0AAV7PDP6_PLEWA|nr:hypothetical protein NDU88_003736 [Pleurodeles waltl]
MAAGASRSAPPPPAMHSASAASRWPQVAGESSGAQPEQQHLVILCSDATAVGALGCRRGACHSLHHIIRHWNQAAPESVSPAYFQGLTERMRQARSVGKEIRLAL